MSWMTKLYDTYQRCADVMDVPPNKLWPVSHLVKKAHVEIVLDGQGKFRRARKLGRTEASTLIPVTESSAGRTSGSAPHPLCEEIGYCASDFPEIDVKRFEQYEEQLAKWCNFSNANPKISAVLTYIRSKSLWTDLCKEQIFPVTVEDAKGKKAKVSDSKVFVRWRVEIPGSPISGTWEDNDLIHDWIDFDQQQNFGRGFCIVTGNSERICQSHSRFIRRSDDGAKLVSANDFSGYTFRGRFTDGKDDYQKQTCSVGYEVSQKAHNALRWLIERQGYRNGDQVIVAWAVNGSSLPDAFANTAQMFGVEAESEVVKPIYEGDAGQAFAVRLIKYLAGYRAQLGSTDETVVMALDSATPGRMAITYYRELTGSEFLERVQAWHETCAWHQNYGKALKFVGAPSPSDIAESAFGRRLDDKLRKSTVERLLPCIIDSRPVPRDLVESTVRRAVNRSGLEEWEWEKTMGIACALFRGHHKERRYQMALELDRKTRDYLFGRLLAVAEHLEERALYVAGEKGRLTNAAKLMQRFADRPFSTWRSIELALTPYKTRLRAKRPALLKRLEERLDEIVCALKAHDFMDDHRLSGEFLLGYHCQRPVLWGDRISNADEDAAENEINKGEE